MKKVLTILSIALSSVAFAGGEVKEVCRDKVDKAGKPILDKNTNKPVQDCKKINVHQKLEGTEVPVKK